MSERDNLGKFSLFLSLLYDGDLAQFVPIRMQLCHSGCTIGTINLCKVKLNISKIPPRKLITNALLFLLTVSFGQFSFGAEGLGDISGAGNEFTRGEPSFLPVAEAFSLRLDGKVTEPVRAIWEIKDGYYLYRHQFRITSVEDDLVVGALQISPGIIKVDEWFGEVEVYYSGAEVLFDLEVTQRPGSKAIEVTFQGCADAGLCYPPVTQRFVLNGSVFEARSAEKQKTIMIDQREEQKLAEALLHESSLLSLLLFFVAGIGLAFTPCVFPMVPILSSIIVGQGEDLSRLKAFALSGSYVLGMAITYSIIGTLVGIFGAQLNLQAALQTTPVLIITAALFVGLSLSMFGFYELQLPVSWQNKLNQASSMQSGGKYLSVFAMGAISSLVISPCISAPLVGGLLYISQTGDALLGGGALLSLGLGMGVPLMLIGVAGGYWLPRAGVWMEKIKALFGILLLGVALWLVERLVSSSLNLILWGLLLVGSAVYFGTFESRVRAPAEKFIQFFGLIAMIWGTLLLVGGSSGGKDVFNPLQGITSSPVSSASASFESEDRGWVTVKTLEQVRDYISASDKPAILDVYADWCISCKTMEQQVFTAPAVSSRLKAFTLIRVDVTQNDEEDRALLNHFGLFGPPTLAFFSADGAEIEEVRIQGEIESEPFVKHLESILNIL